MKKTVNTLCGACGILAATLLFAAGCSKAAADFGGNSSSAGGSMARFTLHGDYLYTVDDKTLKVVSIADPATPVEIAKLTLGFGIETIFTKDDDLFIGSQTGMYIYDISNPQFPNHLSTTPHFRSCDPVVAYDTLAFVTLNTASGTWCGNNTNVLQVYDISDKRTPDRISQVQFYSPRGLAVDGELKLVFVCDKQYVAACDFTDPRNIRGLYLSSAAGGLGYIDAYDCIALNGTLLVIGSDGLYQLGYDREKFTLLSKIDIRREQL